MIGPDRQLTTGLRPPLALLEQKTTIHRFTTDWEWASLEELGETGSWKCRDPKHYRESGYKQTLARYEEPLARSVNDLFKVLVRERVADKTLAVAALEIHRQAFGLCVYKTPRPGVVHIYNKKFGARPLVLCDEPLDLAQIYRAEKEFV